MYAGIEVECFIANYLDRVVLGSGITYRVYPDPCSIGEGKTVRVYVQLGARIAVCCAQGYGTPAPWAEVRDGIAWHEDESRCGSCHKERVGWIMSPITLALGSNAEMVGQLNELYVSFAAKVGMERLALRDAKIRELTTELKCVAQMLNESASVQKVEHGLDAYDSVTVSVAQVITGDRDTPGIYADQGQLVNWAIDPGSWPSEEERVEVRVPLY